MANLTVMSRIAFFMCIILVVKGQWWHYTTTTDDQTTEDTTETSTNEYSAGIRLVGGYYSWEGRVEILHNGQWGTVCDDGFDRNDAQVICAMLGYSRYGNILAYGSATFGEGSGPILLDDLRCSGYESQISECQSRGWNQHNCGHGEDAGVSCQYPHSAGYSIYYSTTSGYSHDLHTTAETDSVTVSLVNIQSRLTYGSYGYLEVYHNGRWGYVCEASYQSSDNFNALCQSLGYSYASGVYMRYSSTYDGIIQNLYCTSHYGFGTDECVARYFTSTRYCSRRLYLNCESQTTEEAMTTIMTEVPLANTPLRLTYGSSGYLEVYHNGRWGDVCYANYGSTSDFDALCQSLGYSYATSVSVNYSPVSNGIIDNLRCSPYAGFGLLGCSVNYFSYSRHCDHRLYLACDSVTTQATWTVPNGCTSSLPADIVFVVDESGSVGSDNFDRTRHSISDSIRHLNVSSDLIRVGVMTFDDNPRTIFNLNSYTGSTYSMINSVTSMSYSSGGTDIANALSNACNSMFTGRNGDRPNAQNYLVLLTDGGSDKVAAQRAADSCKAAGTRIISVGIGDSIDQNLLKNIAYNYDYYLNTNYSEIAEFLPQLVTTAVNCGGLDSTDARHVTVNCQHSNWYIKVSIPPLKQKYSNFKEGDIYLGSDSCTGHRSGDYLIFDEDYTTCGTTKTTTANTVIYHNTLIYAVHDPLQHYIINEYRFNISLECDMSKTESGENNINNNHGHLEQQTLAGIGHFAVQLKFYSDSKYQHEFNGFPPSYMVGQNVYVKAETPIHDYNVKMRLSECYTKPDKYSSDTYRYYLIKNGCPAEPNAFITSHSTHETRFYFQEFEYAFHPESMFVHCNATFCHANDYSRECEPQCSHRKRVGSGISVEEEAEDETGSNVTAAQIGAIGYAEYEATIEYRKGPQAPESLASSSGDDNKSHTGKPAYIIGVVVVAVAMITSLVAITTYFRYKRRTIGESKVV